MNFLYGIREQIKELYARYDLYFRLVLKFALGLLIDIGINSYLGYMSALNHLFILFLLAAVSAILPLNGMVIIGMALLIAHSIALSPIVGMIIAVIYILMLMLYFRFVPEDALVIILTPMAFFLHLPMAVPVTLGLIGRPVSVISLLMGILSWRMTAILPETLAPMIHGGEYTSEDLITVFGQKFLSHEMILFLIVSVVVMVICAAVRQLLNKYAWRISILIGTILYVGLMLAGSSILEANLDPLTLILGALGAMAFCLVLEFFLFSANYAGTELLQFEDDQYYYKVRITPKTMVERRAENAPYGRAARTEEITAEETQALEKILRDQMNRPEASAGEKNPAGQTRVIRTETRDKTGEGPQKEHKDRTNLS